MRKQTAHGVINVLTLLCVIAAVGGTLHVLNTEPEHDPETELYILTESENGTQVVSEYPRTLPVNGSESVVVGIQNHLPEERQYMLEVRVQDMNTDGENITVERQQTIVSRQITVDANEQSRVDVGLTAPFEATDLRVAFLLDRSDGGSDTSVSDAYRSTYFWVNQTASP